MSIRIGSVSGWVCQSEVGVSVSGVSVVKYLYILTGTGASGIYPLLGCRMNEWRFLATEIDNESFQSAKDNVERNHLQNKIKGTQTLIKGTQALIKGHL